MYDIYRLTPDGDDVERQLTHEQRMELWDRKIFDSPDEDAGADGLGPCYFRRNIHGGSRLAQTLLAHDLGYYRDLHVDWDSVKETQEKYDAEHGVDAWHELPRSQQFALAPDLRKALSLTTPDTPGINVAKLCYSNDGWIITPAEYVSMLGMFRELPEETQAQLTSDDWDLNGGFGPNFHAFAQACARSGGSATW